MTVSNKITKVLLVEDLLIPARAVMRLLINKQCQIDWVKTGVDAIDKSKLGYDFILLDLGLPDIDGYTVAESIRNRNDITSKTPIIALTAHAADNASDHAKECGIDVFLIKPLNEEHCDWLIETFAATNYLNN